MTRLGYQIPNFTYPGTAATDLFPAVVRQARAAEASGFDTVLVMDHFYQLPGLGSPDNAMLECYTLLSALAQHTQSARLSALVTGNTYRNPALLAKEVTTLDHVSAGRAQLGIGAGWFQLEHDSLGFEFGTFTDRFSKLEESLQIIRGMLAGDRPSLDGRWYKVDGAINSPAPLSKIPVALYADESNLICQPDEVGRKLDALAGHCEAVGRDRSEVVVTLLTSCCIAPTHEQAMAEAAAFLADRGIDISSMSEAEAEQVRARVVLGDPDEVGGILSSRKVDGIDGFIVNAPANGHIDGRVELLGEVLRKIVHD
jgi:alkanesulfonate monooxygenase SsuD/methylene tetrahydromethanopterin reductase-like flavin-dependent oxidoreductase (luciferase family)